MHIETLRKFYNPDRLTQVDQDFLSFEEDMIAADDLQTISDLVDIQASGLANPHNSVLLYVTGITNQFDFTKGRSDTIDGTPPDIDIDFDAHMSSCHKIRAGHIVQLAWGCAYADAGERIFCGHTCCQRNQSLVRVRSYVKFTELDAHVGAQITQSYRYIGLLELDMQQGLGVHLSLTHLRFT